MDWRGRKWVVAMARKIDLKNTVTGYGYMVTGTESSLPNVLKQFCFLQPSLCFDTLIKKKDEYVFTIKLFSSSCFTFDWEGRLGESEKINLDGTSARVRHLSEGAFPRGCPLLQWWCHIGRAWRAQPPFWPHLCPLAFPGDLAWHLFQNKEF